MWTKTGVEWKFSRLTSLKGHLSVYKASSERYAFSNQLNIWILLCLERRLSLDIPGLQCCTFLSRFVPERFVTLKTHTRPEAQDASAFFCLHRLDLRLTFLCALWSFFQILHFIEKKIEASIGCRMLYNLSETLILGSLCFMWYAVSCSQFLASWVKLEVPSVKTMFY